MGGAETLGGTLGGCWGDPGETLVGVGEDPDGCWGDPGILYCLLVLGNISYHLAS